MKSLKIAFIHVNNPADPHTWSGIPSTILAHLIRSAHSGRDHRPAQPLDSLPTLSNLGLL